MNAYIGTTPVRFDGRRLHGLPSFAQLGLFFHQNNDTLYCASHILGENASQVPGSLIGVYKTTPTQTHMSRALKERLVCGERYYLVGHGTYASLETRAQFKKKEQENASISLLNALKTLNF
ncbi:MAG: hypothetical protein ACMXYF_02740 [Candidatus Woesearchaeota archaeon]